MSFRLKEGVVLFCMCEEYFIFPSRKAENLMPFILTVSPELVSVLQQGESSCEGDHSPTNTSLQTGEDPGIKLTEKTENKLKRLIAAGFVEEY